MVVDSEVSFTEKSVSNWVIRWGTIEERRALRLLSVRSMRRFYGRVSWSLGMIEWYRLCCWRRSSLFC